MLSAHQQAQHNFSLGQAGETQAIAYLRSKNYQVLTNNLRLKNAEVDVVALDSATKELVFVEVKTRTTSKYGSPALAVTRQKVARMQRVARQYCRQQQVISDYRFDTIAVLPDGIAHFKNITWGM